ncbi:MAG: DUF4924 family protein [Bacteroidales bacterium]|jgi:hypothetical protein|nr:DUF4924 family protein [Bacteroidales bacterium]
MIIAQAKKRENIAEYVLYMWQIEDLIRAYNLDMEKISQHIIEKFEQPEPVKKEIRNWYEGLIDLFKEEGITESGHLQFVRNTVNELDELHHFLLKSPDHLDYIDAYNQARDGLVELTNKSKGDVENEIEACFNGLYGILVLRLQQKTISPSTAEAMGRISKLVSLLSRKYKLFEEGSIEL